MNEIELTPLGNELPQVLPVSEKVRAELSKNTQVRKKDSQTFRMKIEPVPLRLVDEVKTGILSSDEQKKKMEFLFLSERGNQETISANKIVNVSTLESNPRNNLVRKLSNIEAAAEKLKNIKLKVCISEIREKLTSLMQSTNQKIIASVTTIISMFIENVTNLLNNNSNPEKNLEQINKEAVATLQALHKLEKM